MTTSLQERPTTSTVYEGWPTLTGRQKPHHLSETPGDLTLGDKALTLASRARVRAMPWQEHLTRAIMARTADGRWTHPDAVIICPRQNGKSLILSIIVLYRLFVMNETIIFTAQQWKTAEDLWRRTWAMVESRPSLRSRVVRKTCSLGRGTIELKSGAQVVFTTRSADAGRGLTKTDLLIYDEAYNLTESEMSAVGFTQLAADDPQTIYASSAVNQDQHRFGGVLAAIRERGLAGDDPQLLFAEFMAPDDLDREDEATWRYANPSYGVIMTESKLRKMMRGLSTAAGLKSFDVEALGRGDWPKEASAEDVKEYVVEPADWAERADLEPKLIADCALAIDMAPDRSVCTVSAATRRADGGRHLEVVFHGSQSGVVELVKKIVAKQAPRAVVIARNSPAASLAPQLEAVGVTVTLVTDTQMAQACGSLEDDLPEGLISHTGDQRFADALESASSRDIGQAGAWVWDRSGDQPITPIVAGTLALYGLWVEAEEPQRESAYEGDDFFSV